MNVNSLNLKLVIGAIYLIIIIVGLYFLFSVVDIKDLMSYEFIRSNKDIILKYKNENFLYLTVVFFIFCVGNGSPITPVDANNISLGFIVSLIPFGDCAAFKVRAFDNDLEISFKPSAPFSPVNVFAFFVLTKSALTKFLLNLKFQFIQSEVIVD